jgi:subtilisin family serine protease
MKLLSKKLSLAVLSVGFSAQAFSMVSFGQQSVEAKFVPGELLVKLKKGEKLSSSFFNDFGVTVKEEIPSKSGMLLRVETDGQKSLGFLISKISQSSSVKFAEPNYIYSINNTPNDPRFGELWGLNNTGANDPSRTPGTEGADISAFRAWDIEKGSKGIKIAVIDTGVDYTHPDLAANMWANEAELNGEEGVDDDGNGFIDDIHGWDFANDDSDPIDGHSHGTHCAGTIGAVHDNGVGVAGVMADVSIVAIKFLSDSGSGTTANAVKAIQYATSLDVDLMSNSWGGGGFSQALYDAIEEASEAGIVFTAAAGNSATNNDQRPHYPSNYDLPNVVSVAAHTAQDTLASFSCYGAETVYVAAPGHKILSTVKNGGYDVYSGTSMATPHVSGAIGLLLSKEGRMDHLELRERLMGTSAPIRAYRRKTISGGRLNAYNLLTNTRPSRNEPDPTKWQEYTLEKAFETEHPYPNNASMTESYTVPGAKYIRVVVDQYELENDYDFLTVTNGSRNEIEKFSGRGEGYKTDYVEGDTVNLSFSSDGSVNRWGVKVTKLEVIME